MVEALAAEGAHVWVADIADDAGMALAAEWDGPGSIRFAHLDVVTEDDWLALRTLIVKAHGHLDALVNNAGIASRQRLPHVELDQWRLAFDVNVTGPLLGIQVLHPLLPRGGSIVNVISVAALSGHVAAAYTASKWALRGLTRTAALEFGEQGIRVNGIFPGLVDTALMAGASPAFRETAIAETPLGRIGVPTDIAPMVVYLVSDESSFVTGAEIAMDGGLTSHVSHKSIADATASRSH